MSNRLQTVLSKLGIRVLAKGALMMIALIAIGYGVKQLDFEGTFKALNFSDDPNAGLLNGRTGFLLTGILATAIGAPRQIVSFFAAYFFGLWAGIFLALAATSGGCLLGYLFASVFSRQVADFIKGRVGVAIDFWRNNPFNLTLIIRLLPLGSNFLTNLTAGASGVPLPAFLAGSTLGYIPQTAVFAIMGSGVNLESSVQITVSIVLFVISTLLGLSLYGRYRKSVAAS